MHTSWAEPAKLNTPEPIEPMRTSRIVVFLGVVLIHASPAKAATPAPPQNVQPAWIYEGPATYARLTWSASEGATWTVTATDSTLVLKTRGGTDQTVRPAYGDTFTGAFLLSFTRAGGATGKVDGMLMSSGRVRKVRFEKR